MLEAIVATIALSSPLPVSMQEAPPPRMQQRERGPGMGEARPDRGGRPGPGNPPRGGMPRGEGMGPGGEMWREFAEAWEQIEPARREQIREEMRQEFMGVQERFRRELGDRLRGEPERREQIREEMRREFMGARERFRRELGERLRGEMQRRGEPGMRGPGPDRARGERGMRGPGAMGDGPGMRDRLREAMRRDPAAAREAMRQRFSDRAGRGGTSPRMPRGMMRGRGMGMPPAMRGGPLGPRHGGMAMGRGGPRGGVARGGAGCCCDNAGPGPRRMPRGGAWPRPR